MENNIENFNQTGTPVSKVDRLSGKHTTTIIVGLLFVITLIALIILVCVKDNISDSIVTGLIGLLGVLAGFFAGTAVRKES